MKKHLYTIITMMALIVIGILLFEIPYLFGFVMFFFLLILAYGFIYSCLGIEEDSSR